MRLVKLTYGDKRCAPPARSVYGHGGRIAARRPAKDRYHTEAAYDRAPSNGRLNRSTPLSMRCGHGVQVVDTEVRRRRPQGVRMSQLLKRDAVDDLAATAAREVNLGDANREEMDDKCFNVATQS